MDRTFTKHTFTVTVVVEGGPMEWDNLSNVAYEIDQGDAVGHIEEDYEEIDAATAAALLSEFGSEPAFFRLDAEGNDLDAESEETGDDHFV